MPRDVEHPLDDSRPVALIPDDPYMDGGGRPLERQLCYGPVNPGSELGIHCVGIDAHTVRPIWWIDLDEGTRTIPLEEATPDNVFAVAARAAEKHQHN